MLKKEANEIVGGLSAPGKMPCPSINLPATACKVGAKLARVPGTTCHGCYALKGRYNFKYTKIAMARRLEALKDQRWVRAMVTLMQGRKHFRWHDSGDIQSAWHLARILEVCKQTPETSHWLPTREAQLLALMDPEVIPKNLIIRLSATKVDGAASKSWPWTSTVSTTTKTCPAPDQGGKCKSCRRCWNRSVKNVQYAKH
tara:strand:- start:639 stop:1238 length:600 start_codon:yes stop_codon:yes gene_type:complete